MGVPPSVKARKSGMFVRVPDAGLMPHVECAARPSVRADTRAFRSMALTGPMGGPRFGVPIPSPAGVSSEVSVQERNPLDGVAIPMATPDTRGTEAFLSH